MNVSYPAGSLMCGNGFQVTGTATARGVAVTVASTRSLAVGPIKGSGLR